jgi:hypothetical protein
MAYEPVAPAAVSFLPWRISGDAEAYGSGGLLSIMLKKYAFSTFKSLSKSNQKIPIKYKKSFKKSLLAPNKG